MLVVRVELHPGGVEARKQVMGVAEIVNDGTGTATHGNYSARLLKWGPGKRVWKACRILAFPRQAQGPWDLLYHALKGTVGAREAGAGVRVAGSVNERREIQRRTVETVLLSIAEGIRDGNLRTAEDAGLLLSHFLDLSPEEWARVEAEAPASGAPPVGALDDPPKPKQETLFGEDVGAPSKPGHAQ